MQCSFKCGYRSARLSYLQRHELSKHETDSFEFVCTPCGYATNRNDCMKRHELTQIHAEKIALIADKTIADKTIEDKTIADTIIADTTIADMLPKALQLNIKPINEDPPVKDILTQSSDDTDNSHLASTIPPPIFPKSSYRTPPRPSRTKPIECPPAPIRLFDPSRKHRMTPAYSKYLELVHKYQKPMEIYAPLTKFEDLDPLSTLVANCPACEHFKSSCKFTLKNHLVENHEDYLMKEYKSYFDYFTEKLLRYK